MAAMQVVADELGKLWHERVLLVNRPGAGGAIAARDVASSQPDGQTLFLALASAFLVLPTTQPDLASTMASMMPVGFVGEVPMGIATSPTLPVRTLTELVELSKKSSAGLDVAVAFKGGLPELTTELFRTRSGGRFTAIHYPGSAQAISDVMSGRVPVIVEGIGGPVAGGQLRLLAIASRKRLASHPDIPTVSETIPGFAASGWFVLVAPPKTPLSIAEQINHDLSLVLSSPETMARFEATGTSTRPMSVSELQAFMSEEKSLWAPIVKQLDAPHQ
jgi:tripartite-type tricarboxylate transporter receptor subunit TctC